MLQRLDEDFWFAKFDFLLKNTDKAEFRELPYCAFRDLSRLFRAEFAYLGNNMPRLGFCCNSRLLKSIKPCSEKLLLKIGVRENPRRIWLTGCGPLGKIPASIRNCCLTWRKFWPARGNLPGPCHCTRSTWNKAMSKGKNIGRRSGCWPGFITGRTARTGPALFPKGERIAFFGLSDRFALLAEQVGKQPTAAAAPVSVLLLRGQGIGQDKYRFKDLNESFVNWIDADQAPVFWKSSLI